MFKAIQKTLSFHIFDIAGIIVGLCLVHSLKDMDLFNVVVSPELYLMIFFSMFLLHSFIWLFMYHGENAYIKRTIGVIVRDFLRITLACISVIGVYFFSVFLS